MELNKGSSALIIVLLFIVLTPSLLFALDVSNDAYYDAAGICCKNILKN